VRRSVRRAATEQTPVAVLGHPARPGEVGFPGAPRPIGLALRIKAQHDAGDLFPVGPLRRRAEQAKIGHQVLFVVAAQNERGRRHLGDVGS